jgi:hypothetical protein
VQEYVELKDLWGVTLYIEKPLGEQFVDHFRQFAGSNVNG